MTKSNASIEKLRKARIKRLAQDELMRRHFFRLDDEEKRIRKMSDNELEEIAWGKDV